MLPFLLLNHNPLAAVTQPNIFYLLYINLNLIKTCIHTRLVPLGNNGPIHIFVFIPVTYIFLRAADADEEDATPWDADARAEAPDEGVTARRTGERHRNSHGRTNGNMENRGPNREEQRSGPAAGIAPDSQRQVDPGEHLRAENGQSDGRTAAKRKMTTSNRHRQRGRKRAATAATGAFNQSQRELQLIAGADISPEADNSRVPWEHRGILGHRGEGGNSWYMRNSDESTRVYE